MNFIVIAAGCGSRLSDEGIAVPKPLVDLDGQPMIGRLLDIFAMAEARRVCVVVNSGNPEVNKYLESRQSFVSYQLDVLTRDTPGSMYTLREAIAAMPVDEPFVATTVDTVFAVRPFMDYVRKWEKENADYDGLMGVTRYVDDEKPLYIQVTPDMTIKGYYDAPTDRTDCVSAGVYGLRPEVLSIIDRCVAKGATRMRDFQRELVAVGHRLRAFDLGVVIDVDHAADIEAARDFLKE